MSTGRSQIGSSSPVSRSCPGSQTACSGSGRRIRILGFEESALARLRRYREEADLSLELIREAEAAARPFSSRLFAGVENTAGLGGRGGFEIKTPHRRAALAL